MLSSFSRQALECLTAREAAVYIYASRDTEIPEGG